MVSFKPRPLYLQEKKPPISIGQEAGWALQPGLTLQRREKSALARNRNPEVHPVACSYTD
jgi:hypothetical protein